MRRDYLADLEAAYEVYLAAKAQHAPGSPALAHVEKLAGIRPILPRLQVRREQAEQVPAGRVSAAQALQPEHWLLLLCESGCALPVLRAKDCWCLKERAACECVWSVQ